MQLSAGLIDRQTFSRCCTPALYTMFAHMRFSIGYRLPAREPDSAQGHQGSQHLPHGRHEGEAFPLVGAGLLPWRARFLYIFVLHVPVLQKTTKISASKVFGTTNT